MRSIDLDAFIHEHVTGRARSLFAGDLEQRRGELEQALRGRSLLVIGGAGSIGTAFIDAALAFRPDRLVVVDTNENALTEITRDLRSRAGQYVPTAYRTYPMSFGDPAFGRMLRRGGRFEVVANFAAHKHVRSAKDGYAIEAMIRNNLLLGRELLEMQVRRPPERLFFVSTDKAADPVNVMGATKKLMEDMLMAYAGVLPVATARFANVAFSNGSLLDGFRYRLRKRQPLSCPSDVRRYFVSPRESGEISLLACLLGRPGEIFFPKLPASAARGFGAIAEAFLRAHGLEPRPCGTEAEARRLAADWRPGDGWWPVYFFPSDTSGEKPVEVFHTPGEAVAMDRFQALGVIQPPAAPPSRDRIGQVLADLEGLFERDSLRKEDIIGALRAAVPTFMPVEKGKGLDDRM